MAFSLIAAVLTLAACLSVLVPAVRGREAAAADTDHDLEVYQDQLAELERDVARGTIDAPEANEARAEIGRRILKAASEKGSHARGTKAGRLVATFAILAVPVASWGIYTATGSPHLPAQPLHARLDKNPAESTVEELVARAEAHLSASPEDGRGWDVLAPIYHRIGRYQEAATAWRNAIRLLGSTADREVALGESIASAAGGIITAEAREAFERALTLEPKNARARFLHAAALAQEGRTAEASEAWKAMLADLEPDSPWRGAIEQALGEAATERPGPVAEDIEAAGLISDKEQAEMIDNMVAGLDQRLRENPADPEGWRRLVHSFAVLGRTEEAADALARGLEALGRDSDAGAGLLAFAAARGVELKEQKGR